MQEQKPRFSTVYPESCSSRERGEHSVEEALSAHGMVWADLQWHVQCIMCDVPLTQVQVLECVVAEAGDEGVCLFFKALVSFCLWAFCHTVLIYSTGQCKMYTGKMCTF